MVNDGTQQEFTITNPLLLLYEQDGIVFCYIRAVEGYTHRHFALLLCDVIRQIAEAFGAPEDDIFRCIERERRNPTAEVIRIS